VYASSTWVCIATPFNVKEPFGTQGRTAVKGTLSGSEFRSSLFPCGDGTHFMMVKKTMQKNTGLRAGDLANFEIERDAEPRTLKVPEDVSAALQSHPVAGRTFETDSHSDQKEWLDWIAKTKKAETHIRRIEKVVPELVEKNCD